MQVLTKPLYAITSVGLEDNLIDVVVMRMILRKAQEQQEVRLRNLEAISHFEDLTCDTDQDDEEYDAWQEFRNAA